MTMVPLSWHDLGIAGLLLCINGVISIVFRLRLEIPLAIAAIRMVAQLTAVGFILKFVFEQTSASWTLGLAAVMILFAAYELLARQEGPLRSWRMFGLGSATLLLAGALGTLYAAKIVIGPTPWYAPRYVLPILGMVLGNTLTSASLVLQIIGEAAERERAAIEDRLALGATRFGAFSFVLSRALKTAMTPLLNTMSVAGVVALPGMMTGQVLAGADPIDAATYQIMIMFVLSGTSGLGALLAAVCSVLLLTDRRHRLRLDRFAKRSKPTAPVAAAPD